MRPWLATYPRGRQRISGLCQMSFKTLICFGPTSLVLILAPGANRVHFRFVVPLSNAQIRTFKAQAQRLKASLKLGRDGLSSGFLAALDDALKHQGLVKVKFDEFKDQKKELAPQLADESGSYLVTRVGNVAVLYRPKPAPPRPAE